MGVGVIGLKTILGDVLGSMGADSNFGKKASLVYGRLMDIVLKLDHIEVEETGKEYLNLHELNLDKRLSEKFEVLRIVWGEMADPIEIQQKDWNSIVDAI